MIPGPIAPNRIATSIKWIRLLPIRMDPHACPGDLWQETGGIRDPRRQFATRGHPTCTAPGASKDAVCEREGYNHKHHGRIT